MKTQIKTSSDILNNVFSALPTVREHHAPDSKLSILLKKVIRKEIEVLFSEGAADAVVQLEPFGDIIFPYHNMGAIDSLNLFDLDECIIFSFYWANRNRYKNVLDIGANLGLHSVILGLIGFNVSSYEPDPTHFEILQKNIALNGITTNTALNMAMSKENGTHEFIRVLGNTTGSHLTGAKDNPYGELDKFTVKTQSFVEAMAKADFIKMDVEGHEKEILLNTTRANWENTDALVEIENEVNAQAIFNHFNAEGITLFSQKTNWQKVQKLSDLPTTYKEGMVFISLKSAMPWGE
jgi:FkbM family methyltransferase